MRAYATQVETLRRLRNGGSQVMCFEHVHVNEGGQPRPYRGFLDIFLLEMNSLGDRSRVLLSAAPPQAPMLNSEQFRFARGPTVGSMVG
jgi:hypothetical protein